ncbi:MAG: putative molybdenum carrier protein [Myxococcota bacterium]|nr:hypothetical protein [Deltaproteobacteria bacterium]MCP4243089.1 hypothetical protein [bacterium]MDP6076507.1 putative molybdenum carrier protein [Myxococcota bacterium]MDP6242203.1 putative molybdenum carrier protein [Myxococcota bacterium]MDP7075687.1 putative molybdenum carrier protein [Myxococcota bacterium]
MLEKIVSGGQSGADRAALDIAVELGLATGGWVPRGRRAEDGRIPERYEGLRETGSGAYATRTERNVRDSDATLVFGFGSPSGGSELTARLARRLGRPLLVLDLSQCTSEAAATRVRAWLAEKETRILNVAGPRASREPAIAEATARILREALRSPDS